MPIGFSSAPSYFWLNSWVLANIIELATQKFCERYVDYRIDPARRLFDQMVMAARSVRANIAEGSERHETSLESEMRLTDVARASAHELMGDYINYLMRFGLKAWTNDDRRFQEIITAKLDSPSYGHDSVIDAMNHIAVQKARFDGCLEKGTAEDAANCLVVLCLKISAMLTSMLAAQLRDFRSQGGFAENLTQERLEARREQAAKEDAPRCPQCGAPMLRRTIRRGNRQGQQFWGCSNYPRCNGASDMAEKS